MNLKAILTPAVMICAFLATTAAHATDYRWIKTISNDSNYFMTITNTDNGHNNRLSVNSPCMTSTARIQLEIGCAPYGIAPGDTLNADGYVVPWENHKGEIQVKVFCYDSTGSPDYRYFFIQEQSGQVVVMAGLNKGVIDRKPAGGPTVNYKLTLTRAKELRLDIIN